MESVKLVFILLTACAVNIEQICSLRLGYVPDPIQPRTARTVGVASGGVFLIIAIVCAIYKVRRARKRKIAARRVVSQHPPTTNIQSYPPPYSEPGMIYPPPPPYSPYNQSQGMVNPGYQ